VKRKAQVQQKTKADKVKSEKTFAPVGVQSVLKISLPYLVFSLLIIVLVAILQYYFVVSGPSAQKNAMFVDTALRSYVDSILVKLDTSRDFLKEFAKNRQVVTAVAEKDLQRISEFEKLVTAQIPYAQGVKVLFPDQLREDTSATPLVSYAVVDLASKVAKSVEVQPEVISPGTPQQYVAILAPIKTGDKVIGIALLGLDRKVIDNTISKIHTVPGYIEVHQVFYDTKRLVAKEGNPAFKDGNPFAIGKNTTSNWEVAFWPQNVSEFSGQSELIYFALGVVVILGVSAGVNFIGLRTLQHDIKADIGELAKLFLGSSDSKSDPASRFKINFFRDLIITLSRNNINLADGISTAPAVPSADVAAKVGKSSSSDSGLQVESLSPHQPIKIPESIFRAYDIRGIVDNQLTPDVVREIGKAIGSEAFDRGEQKVVVARDGRLSGPQLIDALKEGLKSSGRDVIDIGEVPTPVLYFATNYLDTRSGVMLTGSHNPANYNGLKIVLAGETLAQKDIQQLYRRISQGEFVSGQGSEESKNLVPDYLGQITADVALAQPLKVAVDCGNGVAGGLVPRLLQGLGCEVIGLYCDVDGNFPNHHPDPSKPDNLKDLIKMVKNEQADIGLAFDGDGDRLGVVSSDGSIIWPDRQMMLYAIDVLSRNPGADIIFDVKCSRHLPKVISSHGGRPVMWKTGHSLIKAKMKETGALLAGEQSGHIFFKERWYGFDDALYAAARLLEIIAGDVRSSEEVFGALPNGLVTPELNITISDTRKFEFIKKLQRVGDFPNGKVNQTDGIRVDFDDGWGLVRASNTTPCLVARFEADTQSSLERIQDMFRQQILAIDSSLQVPF
jgi:phosphomannomutase/phosphoglucomutase